MKQWIFQVILFLVSFVAVERFCHKQTHGFRLQKIQNTAPSNSQWDSALPPSYGVHQLQEIFSQPFYFLNSGGQCYAFVSKDEKYVVKFFKLHHMRPENWEDHLLPLSLRRKYQKMRSKRLQTFFSSCKLAHDRFKEGTGLIYLHLNKTDFLKTKLKLFDPIGVVHSVSLDEVPFALQEKAIMAYPTLTALCEAKEYEAAQKRIEALLDLIVTRCEAGLADHDSRKRNFGFIGDHAIEIDLGSFSIDESLKTEMARKKAFLKETSKLRMFVKKYIPQLSDFLDENIKKRLDSG